ncbi:NTE family protein [Sediminihabitans luteus]|uniref:NTE family protein n=1 Tax=Sediminihabitans luteus TaxID=1138585 RepID=A0A2M9CEJ0_9CELL|nr:patatin-like phospholipase family protein [Sediminihabitans luteus]PJJ70366.1 NTE family protein [Sediminihabitans luteus]GII97838.1 patatin [Sediminihabitans luteus]
MNAPRTARRALVLGGGGSAGNAWLIGLVAGLADAGIDVTRPDLTIGTSAGATAAAQLAGSSPQQLLADVLATPVGAARPGRAPARGTSDHLDRTARIIASASDAADMRRRLGAAAVALDAASDGAWSGRWRERVAARFAVRDWPEHDLVLTAVDARTGDALALDRDSGIDLVDAVAASTSNGPPYRIGDALYLDGGYRRNENADLAAGADRVLVLSPFGGRTRHPLAWRMQLAAQVEELEAQGTAVEVVGPDAAALDAFGDDMMNLAARAPAARAGHAQGVRVAGRVAELWA